MTIRILISDDHGVLRAGLRALLGAESDLEVIDEATDGNQAIEKVRELEPDVILLDVSMPGPSGIEVAKKVKTIKPDIKILILTVHEDEGLLQEAMQAGASGYIVKRAVESELIDAIRAVWRGDMYVHPAMTRALLSLGEVNHASPVSQESPIETLTPREVDVLGLIAQGYTNRQTAAQLSISVRTVETHRANLMNKLGLRSRVDLVRYAKEHGFV